jgi:oligopeptidase B
VLRFGFESLNVPESIFDFDTVTREQSLLKRTEVLGGFEASNYLVERLDAPAGDGESVPVSLIRHRDVKLDGSNPLLLYAYGSYGSSTDPWFNTEVISLLDRGFVYAIAHVRGGQEFGRRWYEGGKLLNKKNTFTDFVDCARYLVEKGYTQPGRVFAKGGSAGGLLMGAVANMAPELFGGVIAEVPFVDVVTTMLDHSIPLTTSEFDEWGNPEDPEFYAYMLSYSPYDNVVAKSYPPMLVTTGLHDSQVQYWEPAKWVAKLRATKIDQNLLLLKTDMESGHGGPSGRYDQYEETAFVYAFILKVLGS